MVYEYTARACAGFAICGLCLTSGAPKVPHRTVSSSMFFFRDIILTFFCVFPSALCFLCNWKQ